MNYYKLSHGVDEVEIGREFPQIQKMSKGYKYDAPNSVYSLSRYLTKFPDFEPNLNSFVLHKNSKLTDLLSAAVIGRCGLLISEKLMNVFKKFTLVPVKFYEASVIEKKKVHRYFWMHIVGNDFTSKVDYKNSTFFIQDFGVRKENIKVDSLDDLKNKQQQLEEKLESQFVYIRGDKIIIDHSISKYSFFSIKGFDFNYYINQELKNEILSNSCTGLDLNVQSAFSFSDL